jgi:hypothetical protein
MQQCHATPNNNNREPHHILYIHNTGYPIPLPDIEPAKKGKNEKKQAMGEDEMTST